MKTGYKIYKEVQFVIQKFSGEWSNMHFKEMIQTMVNDPEWKYVDKGLIDLRDVIFNTNTNVDRIAEIRLENMSKSPYFVLLVDKPLQTALVHLYLQKTTDIRVINSTYCSTIIGAIEKLNIDCPPHDVETILYNL